METAELSVLGYTISFDRQKLDRALIHQYLSRESYWAENIPFQTVTRAIDNSLCFGVYQHGAQVGFARLVTDKATFAYLADVFVLEAHRGQGLSKWLMTTILAHPELGNLRRWVLATKDAHGLYEQFGFGPLAPEQVSKFMHLHRPDLYKTEVRVDQQP